MALEVIVKQKLFGNRSMPLDVILGDSLQHGNFVCDRLIPGALGETEFIAYHPDAVARGFSVVWNPQEKHQIALRLPLPSSSAEITDFYCAVERMANHWKGKLVVDGTAMTLSMFMQGMNDLLDFNEEMICKLSQEILDGTHDQLTLYSAMWPLNVGREEAEAFLQNSAYFGTWLHQKQTIQAEYAVPRFYETREGITGMYTLTDGSACLLPEVPAVPFGFTNPNTGAPLECSIWKVVLGIKGSSEVLAELDYDYFLTQIPEDRRQTYDAARFLCLEFTPDEIRALAQLCR